MRRRRDPAGWSSRARLLSASCGTMAYGCNRPSYAGLLHPAGCCARPRQSSTRPF